MRRRWVQDAETGQLIEVTSANAGTPRDHHRIIGDSHYANIRGPNGEDLSTRTKHREFMKATGLTTVDDYRETWRKDEKQRIERKHGIDPTRRRDVERAIATHFQQRRR